VSARECLSPPCLAAFDSAAPPWPASPAAVIPVVALCTGRVGCELVFVLSPPCLVVFDSAAPPWPAGPAAVAPLQPFVLADSCRV